MRLVVVAAVAALAGPAAAQGTRFWRPDERVIITDFTVITAMAATESRVFAVTPYGIGIYDRHFRRWLPPVTSLDGFPRERILAALADPADEGLWLATAAGLVKYLPLLQQFDSYVVPGGVRDLAFDRDDPFRGVYLRTGRGWQFLQRGSFVPAPATDLPPAGRRAGTLTVDHVLARQPVADAMRGAVLTDDRLRTFRYTSAVAIPLVEEYYLGTDGLGVLKLDAPIGSFERLPFGLLARGVGALFAAPGGVWTGTDHRSRRAGLSFVGDDLQQYRYLEGPRATGLGITGMRALMGRGTEIWAATDRGVIRFAADGGTRVLGRQQGLPDDDVFALAQGPSGVWVGTAFGLGFVTNDGTVRWIGRGGPIPVLALSAARDTAWVGTTGGLGIATPTSGVHVPRDVAAVPELKTAIVAVTRVADTIVASTVDRLVWRPLGQAWRIERLISPEIGPVYALAADDGGVWIAGDRGIAFYRFRTQEYRTFAAPGDLPGPARDIVVNGPYVWVATEGGLVRFDREALLR